MCGCLKGIVILTIILEMLVVPFIQLKRLENFPFLSYAKLWSHLKPKHQNHYSTQT